MKNKYLIKSILFIFITALVISCVDEKAKKKEKLAASPILAFLDDVNTLENKDITGKTPIISFKESAKANADKTIIITKENIKSALLTAKEYKHAVIIVENHTVVKITDLNNCKDSGSWAACIPFAEGYIKKGTLNYKKDYANNIIGRPDTQERILYLFK